jgi:hypothetical protein
MIASWSRKTAANVALLPVEYVSHVGILSSGDQLLSSLSFLSSSHLRMHVT